MAANEYLFRVRGRLSADVVAALDPLRPVAQTSETVLRGVIIDQAALYGTIARFEQLGLDLVELARVPRAGEKRTTTPGTSARASR
jgi:hypothetical protein